MNRVNKTFGLLVIGLAATTALGGCAGPVVAGYPYYYASPVVAAPMVAAPMVATPVIAAPMAAAPMMAAPVVAAPSYASPVVATAPCACR